MTRKITDTFIHYHLGLYHASPPLGKLLQPILARKYLALKREGRESEWRACLDSIGAKPKLVEGDYSEAANGGEVVVLDLSVPKKPITMTVSRETALKILLLGELP